MNPPKVTDDDYINFIIATPRDVTAAEAERVQPESKDAPALRALSLVCSPVSNPMRKRFGRRRERKLICKAAFRFSMILLWRNRIPSLMRWFIGIGRENKKRSFWASI
jgi:hypothetical protein